MTCIITHKISHWEK